MRTKLFLGIMSQFVGIEENGGNNRGEFVQWMQRAVDGHATNEPWCMCAQQRGVLMTDEIYKSLDDQENLTKSEIFRSEHCMTVWNKTPTKLKSFEPTVGSIVIWNWRGTNAGHTGTVEAIEENHLVTLEGNTGNANVREGDGFYRKRRPRKEFGGLVEVGFIRPWGI